MCSRCSYDVQILTNYLTSVVFSFLSMKYVTSDESCLTELFYGLSETIY